MAKTIWDLEIKMLIPFDIMIFYPDEDIDEYIVEPIFQMIVDSLNIKINIVEIVKDLYKNRGKNSSISVYFSDCTYKNFILLDTEIDATDQLDLIYICIRCTAENGGAIRTHAHEFYTKRCMYNIAYSEGNYIIRDLYKYDFSKFNPSGEIDYGQIIKNRKINFYQSGALIKSITT